MGTADLTGGEGRDRRDDRHAERDSADGGRDVGGPGGATAARRVESRAVIVVPMFREIVERTNAFWRKTHRCTVLDVFVILPAVSKHPGGLGVWKKIARLRPR
jgi:hypothetical protein